MKFVIKCAIFFATLIIAPINVSFGDPYRETILREAAIKNGYKVPKLVNREFDPKKSALGKVFFESTELSFNSNTSCSSCHLDEFSSTDGLPIAIGIHGHGKGIDRIKNGGAVVPRNTLPMWGRGSLGFDAFFWDGKVQSKDGVLISQFGDAIPSEDALAVAVSLPFLEIREMVSDNKFVQENLMTETISSAAVIQSELVNRVIHKLDKGSAIAKAYEIGEKEISFMHIADSIAHFFADKFRLQETKFSNFVSGKNILGESEVNGGLIFYGKGQCSSCHSGPHFSDFNFHTILTPQFGFGKNGFGVDYGRFNSTFKPDDLHKFRTPPLHNVKKTSPYGHSGSLRELQAIIQAHYDPLVNINTEELNAKERRELFDRLRMVGPNSPLPAALSKQELNEVEAFLSTLSF